MQAVIEEWRQHITDNFYNCTPEIFRFLGQLYIYDERFTGYIDKTKPELAIQKILKKEKRSIKI